MKKMVAKGGAILVLRLKQANGMNELLINNQ